MLQLQRFVHLPALTEVLAVHIQSVGAGPQLTRYLGQRAEAFTVDVLHGHSAGLLAAFLGGLGPSAAICDVCEGWS